MMGQALPAVTCLIVLPFAHMRRQTPQALPKSEGGLLIAKGEAFLHANSLSQKWTKSISENA